MTIAMNLLCPKTGVGLQMSARLFTNTHPVAFLIEVEEHENISQFYVSALKRKISALLLLLMQRRAGMRFKRKPVNHP